MLKNDHDIKSSGTDAATMHEADGHAEAARFPRSPVLFCDFDGTITMNDNIVALMKHFKPPGASEIVDAVIHRRMSIREGVGAMFALIPSARRPELESFLLQSAVIRPGFSELLAWCRKHEVPFYVTSGGIDFFVYPLLEPFNIPHDHIYCNGSDFSGEYIKITWPHPCDEQCDTDCGMCKATIMRQFPQDRYYRMLIGDSVTDFAGAKLADLVFRERN